MNLENALQTLNKTNNTNNNEKIQALHTMQEEFTFVSLRQTPTFMTTLRDSISAIVKLLDDSDMNVWSAAEETLNKIVSGLMHAYPDAIVSCLYSKVLVLVLWFLMVE